jgi:hypothetical protein
MATKKKKSYRNNSDAAYILKLVLYVLIGAQWIWLVDPELSKQIPLPVGFIIGIIYASHDHFKIDRKIEYAVLLVAMFIGFWFQSGISIVIL